MSWYVKFTILKLFKVPKLFKTSLPVKPLFWLVQYSVIVGIPNHCTSFQLSLRPQCDFRQKENRQLPRAQTDEYLKFKTLSKIVSQKCSCSLEMWSPACTDTVTIPFLLQCFNALNTHIAMC